MVQHLGIEPSSRRVSDARPRPVSLWCKMVLQERFELSRLAALVSETSMSASSITGARNGPSPRSRTLELRPDVLTSASERTVVSSSDRLGLDAQLVRSAPVDSNHQCPGKSRVVCQLAYGRMKMG